MLPYQVIDGGSFVADSTLRKQVQVTDRPDLVWVRNRTEWGDASAVDSVESWFRYGMAQDSAQASDQTVVTNALSSAVYTSNGFRVYNTANPPTFTALATTAITAANPAVASMASTGSIRVGDVVKVSNSTGMLQISGYDFEVTALTSNVSATLNLDASAFAAAATAGDVQLFIPNRFYPRWRYIVPLAGSAGITQAAQAVVSFSVAHDFSVGERVSFRVGPQFGMNEINNKSGIVQSVTTYTITVDIDTSGFTAFAMPASGATATDPYSPAIVVPAGAGPTPNGNPPGVSVQAAADNRNIWLIDMGSNVITAAEAEYDWVAFKYDKFTAE
jgi:hypothetical protein